MALFESYDRRIGQIQPVMDKYGIKDFEDARNICKEKGFDPYEIVKGVQPICFENACWAYTLGAAIAIKSGRTKAADAAKAIGEGLQAFCIPGSVADDRKVGLGHGNLASMLLSLSIRYLRNKLFICFFVILAKLLIFIAYSPQYFSVYKHYNYSFGLSSKHSCKLVCRFNEFTSF